MAKNICANCKFYTERYAKGLFGSARKYYVCYSPKTVHQKGEVWWNDGEQVTLGEGFIQELLVGCNFGCVNFEENEDER